MFIQLGILAVLPRGELGLDSCNATGLAGELQGSPGSFCPAQTCLVAGKTIHLRFL